jgi:hypothetical protein
MELVERLELGGKRQLMLVVCDGQRYLLGAGGDGVHSITEMRSQAERSSGAVSGGDSFCEEKTLSGTGFAQEMKCNS